MHHVCRYTVGKEKKYTLPFVIFRWAEVLIVTAMKGVRTFE
jgi:hypothetical protein